MVVFSLEPIFSKVYFIFSRFIDTQLTYNKNSVFYIVRGPKHSII